MKKKKLLKNNSPVSTVIISSVTGILLSLILMLFSALIMTKYDINKNLLIYFWISISVISGFFIGITAGKLSKSKGIIWGSLSALTVSVLNVLVLCIAVSFGASLTILSLIPAYTLPGAIGAVISSNFR